MQTKILAALKVLDPDNNEHWTDDGSPRMTAVEGIVGDAGITRKQVTEVDPSFTRDVARSRKAQAAEAKAKELADSPTVAEANSDPEPEPEPEPEAADDLLAEPTVLDKPLTEVMGNPALLELAIAELSTLQLVHLRARNSAQEQLDQTNAKIEYCEHQLVRLRRGKVAPDNSGIRDYLERQNVARAERAKRAQDFIAARITLADLGNQIGPSKLDRALSNRRRDPSAKRPERGPVK